MEMGWVRRVNGSEISEKVIYSIEYLKTPDFIAAGISNVQPDWYGTKRNVENKLIAIMHLTLEPEEKNASAKTDMKLLALIQEKFNS